MSAASLIIKSFSGEAGFSSLYAEWLALMSSIDRQCFYHHPAWFRAYFSQRRAADALVDFGAVYRGSRLVAVLPVIRRRPIVLFSQASLAFGDGLYMPDWAVADSEDPAAVWEFLRDNMDWDVFSANDTLETASIVQCVDPAARKTRFTIPGPRCAVVDIIHYPDLIKDLKKKFRGNLNTARHRLGRQKCVEFLHVTHPDKIEEAFTEFVELEKSGWKGEPERVRGNYPAPAAIALKQSKLRFYQTAVQEFAQLGSAEVCLLRVNGRTIGAQILVLLNRVSYLLKTAFDEGSREFSPGHMLIDFACRRYSEGGSIRELNLISDYDWFKYWNPRYVNYVTLKDFNESLSGLLASAVYGASRSIRDMIRTS